MSDRGVAGEERVLVVPGEFIISYWDLWNSTCKPEKCPAKNSASNMCICRRRERSGQLAELYASGSSHGCASGEGSRRAGEDQDRHADGIPSFRHTHEPAGRPQGFMLSKSGQLLELNRFKQAHSAWLTGDRLLSGAHGGVRGLETWPHPSLVTLDAMRLLPCVCCL